MRKLIATTVAASIALSACATNPNRIEADYVSPARFADLNCNQLMEYQREIDNRVAKLTGRQRKAANTDTTLFWTGMLLFWPALFVMPFMDDGVKEELELAKGESEALRVAAKNAGCF